MNTNRNFMKYGAMTAAAVIVAGGIAYASSSLQAQVFSVLTDEVIAMPNSPTTNGDSKNLINWLSTTTMPVLDNVVAIREEGKHQFKLNRPSPLASAIRESVTQLDHCHPYWRPLVSGPVGREVANICPGNALLPMPTVDLHSALKLQLPTPTFFNRALAQGELDRWYQPNPTDAYQAGTNVLHLLQSRDQNRLTQSEGDRSTAAPFLNPLGWSAAPAAGQLQQSASRSTSS